MTPKDHFYFEDIAPRQVFRSARAITLDRAAIVAFARQYDPQPAHLGEEAARNSQFGVFCASGWQTCSVTMRLMTETLPIAGGGMGAGIEQLRWLRPVRPGDTLSIEIEILEARPSASRPDKGVVLCQCTTFNQRGEAVQRFATAVLFPRREATLPS